VFLPVRGRFRVAKNYAWSDEHPDLRHREVRIMERGSCQWQVLLAGITNMPIEIANVTPGDRGSIRSFLGRWGLPVIEDSDGPASMTASDFDDLVRTMRTALSLWSDGDTLGFARHLRAHGRLAIEPRYDPALAPGSAPMYIECRDPASFAWCQLGQQERRNVEYRRCRCGAYFAIAGVEGHRRSRQYCSDRCRVAANREKNRKLTPNLNPP
jgi:hypothetical protein